MKKSNSDFYQRMQEAKERKKKFLEQQQLEADFIANPHMYQAPGIPKTEWEVTLDQTFEHLRTKLQNERPLTQEDRINKAFEEIAKKSKEV